MIGTACLRLRLNFFGPSLVYTSANGGEMNNFVEIAATSDSRTAKVVAICESNADIQLMEAIDDIGDFLRFVEISTSAAVACQWRMF